MDPNQAKPRRMAQLDRATGSFLGACIGESDGCLATLGIVKVEHLVQERAPKCRTVAQDH